MKKIGIIVFVVAVLVGVIFANFMSFGKMQTAGLFNFSFKRSVKGSGNVAVEKRDVKDFRSLDVSGIIQVEVTVQKDFAVEVEADDNLLQYIRTEVRNGVLELSTKKTFKTSNPIRVRISAPDLEEVEASGATRVSVSGLKNAKFVIDTSGASSITAAGETSELVVDVSGASKIDASELSAGKAAVDSSGASSVTVNAVGELKVDASGASSVKYAGSPQNIEKRTSGASKVVPL